MFGKYIKNSPNLLGTVVNLKNFQNFLRNNYEKVYFFFELCYTLKHDDNLLKEVQRIRTELEALKNKNSLLDHQLKELLVKEKVTKIGKKKFTKLTLLLDE